MFVQHSTDIGRLRGQAFSASLENNQNADSLVIINARVLTMEGGGPADFIADGVLVGKKGVILSVGSAKDVVIPDGATIIDAQGGTSWCL